MTRKSKGIAIAIVLVGGILAGSIKLAPHFIDKDALRIKIEEGLEESTGVQFDIRAIDVDSTIVNGVQVHLSTTQLRDKDGDPLGDIDGITVQIRYLPLLLTRTPEISKVHLNNVYLPVAKQSLFDAIDLHLQEPQEGFLKPAELKDAEILITNYLIEDFRLPATTRRLYPKARRFWVSGDKISIRHLLSDKPVSVLADGQILYRTVQGKRRQARLDQTSTIAVGNFEFFGEIPQDLVKREKDAQGKPLPPKNKPGFEDLQRMELTIAGSTVPLSLKYRHAKDTLAQGHIKSNWLDLEKAESLVFQLGDTFSLPLPNAMDNVYLWGRAQADTDFAIEFPRRAEQVKVEQLDFTMDGHLNLDDAAIATLKTYPRPLARQVDGQVRLNDRTLAFRNLRLLLSDLPLIMSGSLNLDTQALDVLTHTRNVRIGSLKNTLQGLGIATTGLQGREISGVADAQARIAGTLSEPRYRGTLNLRQGTYQDASMGVFLSNVGGAFRFQGQGLADARLKYTGNLQIRQGRYQGTQAPVVVESVTGSIQVAGTYQTGQKPLLPDYSGYLDIAKGRYMVPDTELLVRDIAGRLNLGDTILLENFHGYLGDTLFRAEGTIDDSLDAYRVRITSNDIDIPRFKQQVVSKLPNPPLMLQQLEPTGGTADVNLLVTTGEQVSGSVQLANVSLQTGMEGYPIEVPALTINVRNNMFTIPDTRIVYGPMQLALSGRFARGDYDVRFASNDVPISFVRDHAELITLMTGTVVPPIWNTAGSLTLDGHASQRQTEVAVAFHDVGLSWQGADFPVYDVNGRLYFSQARGGLPFLRTEGLTFMYGTSPVALEIDQKNGRLNAEAEGTVSRLVLNHFLGGSRAIGMPYEHVPFQVAVNGVLGSLPGSGGDRPMNLVADIRLDLEPLLLAARPPSEQSAAVGELPPEPPRPNADPASDEPDMPESPRLRLEPLKSRSAEEEVPPPPGSEAYLTARVELVDESIRVPQATVQLFDSGRLLAQGAVDGLDQPELLAFHGQIVTPQPIRLSELSLESHSDIFQGTQGTFAADMAFQGVAGGLRSATGWVAFDQVAVPMLTLRELTGQINFDGTSAHADIATFAVPGIQTSLYADAPELRELPITLENVRIEGPSLSITSLTDFQKEVVQPIIIDRLIRPFSGPPEPGAPAVAVQFRNADLAFDEVIYENIILENVTSDFSLYPSGFFELSDARLQAAGGQATGYLSMNPMQNNFIHLELNAEDVKANALTRALLNVSNQLYGDLSGSVQFTTFGETPEEMLQNANGLARVKVENGRLPAIARVETLLAAANVFRGGLLGLNLNNLFRTLQVYETNYFAELSGDFQVAEGRMYTENTVIDGHDLDLFIQGSLALEDGAADMVVNGLMSQDVSGVLGPLGQLSLGRIISRIPLIGDIGHRRGGLLGWIPGMGYVPGFGGPAGDYNRFRVSIQGELDSTEAIRDFDWVGPAGL